MGQKRREERKAEKEGKEKGNRVARKGGQEMRGEKKARKWGRTNKKQ